ncbi:hypothetical protein BH24ACI1_BH24ACI1_07630 [soil metagenome]
MANEKKQTDKKAASAASKVLSDGRTSKDSKSAGGSALSQADKKSNKTTGDKAAKKSSKVMQSDDTGKKSKTAAASALAKKKASKK